MRIARYDDGSGTRLGLLEESDIAVLPDALARRHAWDLPADAADAVSGRVPLDAVRLLAPVMPGKIVAVGLNYRDHAAETGADLPTAPLLFAKLPSSVTGPGGAIEMGESIEVDYEGELGVVIGRRARRVSEPAAMGHVAGYVVANDVSARDAQLGDGQWVRGKSFDTFCPLGPALVTTDEISDPHALDLRTWVNGELRQSSNTSNLIFGVAALVAYCSRFFTLEPGDLISTGTPAGVAMGMKPPVYLKPGDMVEIEITGLGRLTNTVVA